MNLQSKLAITGEKGLKDLAKASGLAEEQLKSLAETPAMPSSAFIVATKQLGITGEQLKGLAEVGFSEKDWRKAFVLFYTEPELQDPKDIKDLTNLLIRLMNEEQVRRKSHGFSDRLLCLVPLKHRKRVYEPSKCDAEAHRLERFEKDGNELAANREYRREIRQVVLSTFLALPRFYIGEILDQIRRMVAR